MSGKKLDQILKTYPASLPIADSYDIILIDNDFKMHSAFYTKEHSAHKHSIWRRCKFWLYENELKDLLDCISNLQKKINQIRKIVPEELEQQDGCYDPLGTFMRLKKIKKITEEINCPKKSVKSIN